jgi:hypothetical protein
MSGVSSTAFLPYEITALLSHLSDAASVPTGIRAEIAFAVDSTS